MPFESFLGNVKAVGAVRRMLAAGRVPGALLFTGPDGVGKKTLATMLARGLICERRKQDEGDFCGTCPRCLKAEQMLAQGRDDLARRREVKDSQRRVEGLLYFDIQLIGPITRYILIEQIRQLRTIAYTRPFEFPRRVFIVDEAHAVHWQAVDLLLKVLEEPPETTTIVLVCPDGFKLRPTIRSRCFQVNFLPVEEEILRTLVAQERKLPAARSALGARLARGSVARARTLDLEAFERSRRPWLRFIESVANQKRGVDWSLLFDATRELAQRDEDFDETLRTGYTLLRDLVFLLEGRAESEIVNVDLVARLKPWAEQLGFSRIARLKAGLDQAYRLQTRNVNQQLGLESLAIDLLSPHGQGIP